MHRKILMVVIAMISVSAAYAQDTPMKNLSLQDMSAFKPQAGNWQIVGDVTIDPTIDIHHEPEKAPVETGKKKKKSKEGRLRRCPRTGRRPGRSRWWCCR